MEPVGSTETKYKALSLLHNLDFKIAYTFQKKSVSAKIIRFLHLVAAELQSTVNRI
jgi:hypothetical protein